jgi:hypothetical protein
MCSLAEAAAFPVLALKIFWPTQAPLVAIAISAASAIAHRATGHFLPG